MAAVGQHLIMLFGLKNMDYSFSDKGPHLLILFNLNRNMNK